LREATDRLTESIGGSTIGGSTIGGSEEEAPLGGAGSAG